MARSSAESEYRAMAHVSFELIWVKHLLSEFGFNKLVLMQLWCDSEAALLIASNTMFHERNKHIEVDCHFIWDFIHKSCEDRRSTCSCVYQSFRDY